MADVWTSTFQAIDPSSWRASRSIVAPLRRRALRPASHLFGSPGSGPIRALGARPSPARPRIGPSFGKQWPVASGQWPVVSGQYPDIQGALPFEVIPGGSGEVRPTKPRPIELQAQAVAVYGEESSCAASDSVVSRADSSPARAGGNGPASLFLCSGQWSVASGQYNWLLASGYWLLLKINRRRYHLADVVEAAGVFSSARMPSRTVPRFTRNQTPAAHGRSHAAGFFLLTTGH